MIPDALKSAIAMIIAGTMVSMTHFPRKVLMKRDTPLTRTPLVLMTPRPNIFLPTVWPFFRIIGSMNSKSMKDRIIENDSSITMIAIIMLKARIISVSLFMASQAS